MLVFTIDWPKLNEHCLLFRPCVCRSPWENACLGRLHGKPGAPPLYSLHAIAEMNLWQTCFLEWGQWSLLEHCWGVGLSQLDQELDSPGPNWIFQLIPILPPYSFHYKNPFWLLYFFQRTTGDIPTKCSGSAACVLDDTMYVVAGFHRYTIWRLPLCEVTYPVVVAKVDPQLCYVGSFFFLLLVSNGIAFISTWPSIGFQSMSKPSVAKWRLSRLNC